MAIVGALEKVQWGIKLQSVLDNTMEEQLDLSQYECKGFFPDLKDKIPYTSEFCNKVTSLIILDRENKRYIIIKSRITDIDVIENNFKSYVVLNNVGDIKNYEKFERANVVIPVKFSKLIDILGSK